MDFKHHFDAVCETWLEQLGEAELIGGWAEVALADDFAARVQGRGYQVFVTSYDAVQLFVQNRTERGFEIHALPGHKGRRQVSAHSGYRIVAAVERTRDSVTA